MPSRRRLLWLVPDSVLVALGIMGAFTIGNWLSGFFLGITVMGLRKALADSGFVPYPGKSRQP